MKLDGQWSDNFILIRHYQQGTCATVPYAIDAPALKLNIGCGQVRAKDFVNCDIGLGPSVDVTFDCQKEWPFGDNSAGCIYASHLLEHLDDTYGFFNEAHRVLHPKGIMTLRLPNFANQWAWGSFVHKRAYSTFAFYALQGSSGQGFDGHFQKTWKLREFWYFLEPQAMWLLGWWPWRKWLLPKVPLYAPHLIGEIGVVATKVA